MLASAASIASVAALAAGCGGAPAPASSTPSGAAPGSGKGANGAGLVPMIQSSYLLPELTPEKGVLFREDGHRKILVDRMRIILNEDGSEERAVELMPNSYSSAIALPSRLGGGYLFHSTGGGTTQLWRAASWLGHMEPISGVPTVADEIIAGFDRLYLRLQSSNRLVALDPQTGAPMPLGPLPPSVAYGGMAFADGWRAVVDTDLRGPLVTFDAGTTWRPLRLTERAGTITAIMGDPMVYVGGGKYVIDSAGGITFHPDQPRRHSTDKEDSAAKVARPPGPLGKRPLRAAIEDGFPDDGRTAIVARGGALARVSLRDGTVIKIVEGAYRGRDASCHAVRVGQGYGFVCGERDGATTVLEFVRPFSLKEIWRFAKPRFVSPSGNGALVVRGPCTDDPAPPGEGRTYCIRDAAGATRQIRVTGDLGAERVVALADGRVVVLAPPRREKGQITVLRGAAIESSAALKLPARPIDSVSTAKRGLWLDGFEEREPGVIGGWVEAGGAAVGVTINLKGEVKLGEMRTDSNGPVLGGRFGVSVGDDGDAAETSDGGMTWTSFEMPDHQVDSPARTRACGPVGCALGSWLRVGWGKPLVRGDFATAKTPGAPVSPLRAPATVSMSCELAGSVTPPLKDKPGAKSAPPPPPSRYASPPYRHGYPYGYGYNYRPMWSPFRNTPAPALAKDEVGVDTGSYGDLGGTRSYAWGKKGADWTKVGRWLVRFDDRYDVGGGVRSSAISTPPWADEAAAVAGVGGMTYGTVSWAIFPDITGRAALGQACNGACVLYSLAEGQPALALRDSVNKFSNFTRLLTGATSTEGTAVRVGESWFFLSPGSVYDAVTLWRADLGVVKQVATYFRPTKSRYSSLEPPRLVRRALGTGLGLLVTAPRGQNESSSTWYVLPIDGESGALDEPIPLGRRDLEGVAPPRCAAGQDGWLTSVTLETTPAMTLGGAYGALEGIELKLRLDPGSVCAEAISARVEGIVVVPQKTAVPSRPKPVDPSRVPLAATERVSGQRWVFQCGASEQSAAVAPGVNVVEEVVGVERR